MKKKFAEIRHIENNEMIRWDTHYEFLCHLQLALLLALYERGILTMAQLHRAEKGLQKLRIEHTKTLQRGKG